MAALAYLSNGGFPYEAIMDMSSSDRRFYLRKLRDYKRQEAKSMEDASRAGRRKK